jgi:tetratricopeptide (TPR) repeat protein
MLSKSLRATATALFLGIACAAVATVSLTAPADAAVRAAVGRPLKAALAAAAAGNFTAAKSEVSVAEGVGGLTGDDRAAIAQVRNYIAAKSGGGGAAGGCAGLYLRNDYRGVIALHGRDAQCMQLTAQAYYLTRDFAECTRYIRGNFGAGAGEQILQLQMRCAYESQDNDSMRSALEQLVARTNKPEYWSQLLATALSTKGITDHGTLDIYRLKLLTGSLTKPDDYNLLAQLALQLGFAAESQTVIQKGIDAKLLTGDRTTRLLNMAKGQAGANAGNLQKATAAANRAPNGDALVKLGEDAWGQGRFPDALSLIQAGIKKGVTDQDNAQIRLGMALLGAGQKAEAARAFDKANTDPHEKVIAHLWSIYARTSH